MRLRARWLPALAGLSAHGTGEEGGGGPGGCARRAEPSGYLSDLLVRELSTLRKMAPLGPGPETPDVMTWPNRERSSKRTDV